MFPELCTSQNYIDTPELLPHFETGGGIISNSEVTTSVQMGDYTAHDGVVSEANGLPSDSTSCETDDYERDQELIQVSV